METDRPTVSIAAWQLAARLLQSDHPSAADLQTVQEALDQYAQRHGVCVRCDYPNKRHGVNLVRLEK